MTALGRATTGKSKGAQKRRKPSRVWHYTVAVAMDEIFKERALKPATAGVPSGEKPAIWFTTRSTWEPTASKMLRQVDGSLRNLTQQETETHGRGLVRIEIEASTAPFSWAEHRRHGGVDRKTALALEQVARRHGSDPSQWRLSYDPVPITDWLGVDVLSAGQWKRRVTITRKESGETVAEIHEIDQEL